MPTPLFPWLKRRPLILVLLLVITSGISFAALTIPLPSPFSSAALQTGQVAPQDIVAPRGLTFESAILTQNLREKLSSEVSPIYSPADTSIARRQLERLRSALAYATVVRLDSYATPSQKLSDLFSIEDIHLTQTTALNILALPNSRWQAVEQEAIVVLEDVMHSTIQDDRLAEFRSNVPSLISLSLSEDQAAIVSELVSAYVVPNSLYDSKQTEAARKNASASVSPVPRTFKAGETIIQKGKVLSDLDLEALAQFGLLKPAQNWQDLVSAGAVVAVVMAFLVIYLRRNPLLITRSTDLRSLVLTAALFLFFLISSRLIIPGHTLLPYLFPIAAYSLTVSILFRSEPALVSALPLAILVTYNMPFALELTLYYVLGSFFGVLTLGRGKRVTSFFWAAVAIALASSAVVIAYRLPQQTTDWIGMATLVGAAITNGVASAGFSLLLQFFLAQFLGMTTALQLMELSRPDHPLLQLLLRLAPGTYQHSLQVANLAEQAAEQIGADALLTRVGALYHDVGKTFEPSFFIENQLPGNLNAHDDIDPEISAAMIIQHVPNGLELARKHRLPHRIQDFIREHHGLMLTRYQYVKAIEAAGGDETKVDPERFRYPGPHPQSSETALLMLADGCEARVRAEHPKDEFELQELIKSVIDHRVASGELDETQLTLRDLYAITDSFTATLRGIYHPRILYPKLDTPNGKVERLISIPTETLENNPFHRNTELPTQPNKTSE